MNKEVKDILNQRRKLMVLEYAKAIGNAAEACRDLAYHILQFMTGKKHMTRRAKPDF